MKKDKGKARKEIVRWMLWLRGLSQNSHHFKERNARHRAGRGTWTQTTSTGS